MTDNTDNNNSLDIERLIVRYLASEASESELAVLLECINESDENRRRFFELQDIWHVLNPSFESTDVDLQNAEDKILINSGLSKKQSFWTRGFMKVCSRIAAVLLLPLLLLVAHKYVAPDSKSTAIKEVATTYGCTMKTTLPDGTTVWLNANSSLRYPAKFSSGNRNVDLTGEAYFDVHSDPKHPFIVHTSLLDVEATGTEFNVNSYKGDRSSSVTLVNGHVNVDLNNDGKYYEMAPGDYLRLHEGKVKLTKGCDTEKYCSWRNGILMFDDDTLRDICLRLEHTYGVRFKITDTALAESRYCMTLHGESISDIMNLLELSAPIRCTSESVDGDDSIASSQVITIASL